MQNEARFLPPPCGEGQGWGRRVKAPCFNEEREGRYSADSLTTSPSHTTPTPHPSPQGGGEPVAQPPLASLKAPDEAM